MNPGVAWLLATIAVLGACAVIAEGAPKFRIADFDIPPVLIVIAFGLFFTLTMAVALTLQGIHLPAQI